MTLKNSPGSVFRLWCQVTRECPYIERYQREKPNPPITKKLRSLQPPDLVCLIVVKLCPYHVIFSHHTRVAFKLAWWLLAVMAPNRLQAISNHHDDVDRSVYIRSSPAYCQFVGEDITWPVKTWLRGFLARNCSGYPWRWLQNMFVLNWT